MSLSGVPLEDLPEAWGDEARLNVMYAPYRDKKLNAKDWEFKSDFWKKSILAYCVHHKNSICTSDHLSRAFYHEGRSPSCLDMVMQDMYDKHELVTLHEFKQRSKQATTWSGWAADVLVRRPMAWGFNMMKQHMIRMSIIDDGTFVHLKAVETNARSILAQVPDSLRSKVLELRELDEVFRGYDGENAKLVLHFLECIGEAGTREIEQKGGGVDNVLLVKFGNVRHTGGITDADVDVYMLERTEKILLETVEKLENDVAGLLKDAKGHILKGHKQVAKTCLRKKRDVEKRIGARANALYNVQTLLSRVEDAAHDAHILDTYKFALDSLRTNFKDNKLNEESVTNTMIEIGDVLDIHNDIQSSLAQPLGDSDVDLEAELEQLLAVNDDDDERGKPSNISPKTKDDLEYISDEISRLDLPDVPVDGVNESFSKNEKLDLPDVPVDGLNESFLKVRELDKL